MFQWIDTERDLDSLLSDVSDVSDTGLLGPDKNNSKEKDQENKNGQVESKCIKLSLAKIMTHNLSLSMHNNKFEIQDRRRKVATMLAQSMTETEIAQELKVDQSTISRDIKALKELSQRFVFDLAKSDLAYYYKQCIDGIEEVRRKGWEIFKGQNNNNLTPKDNQQQPAKPDDSCLFHPEQMKCKPDPITSNCPTGFSMNVNQQCYPNKPCPNGFERHEDDEPISNCCTCTDRLHY